MKKDFIIKFLCVTVILMIVAIIVFICVKGDFNKKILKKDNSVYSSIELQDKVEDNEKDENKNIISNGKIELIKSKKVNREIIVKDSKFIEYEYDISVKGMNEQATKKIENYIKEKYSRVWENIKKEVSDYDIKEMLIEYIEKNKGNLNVTDVQDFDILYYNDKIITLKYMYDSDYSDETITDTHSSNGVSFYRNTGEEIKVEDLIIDKEKFVNVCTEYIMNKIKNSEEFNRIEFYCGLEKCEKLVKETVKLYGVCFTEDGASYFKILKRYLTGERIGEFDFSVPYDIIKDCVNLKNIGIEK